MAKSKRPVDMVSGPQPVAAPPEGFRELTKEEAMEFQNFSLHLSAALERQYRWNAEVELAQGKERAAKNEVAALQAVAVQMDAKLGVVDATKDIVQVAGKIYVRKQEAAPAPAPDPAAPEGPQPLPKVDIKVTPGPRP